MTKELGSVCGREESRVAPPRPRLLLELDPLVACHYKIINIGKILGKPSGLYLAASLFRALEGGAGRA